MVVSSENALSARDVERPFRDLLEDWEDAIKNSIDRSTREAAARGSVPGGQAMFRAIGLFNGAKDFGGSVMEAASIAVAPQWTVPWNILKNASEVFKSADDHEARLKVFQLEYDKLRDKIMDKIHDEEINFPNTGVGREIMRRVAEVATGLSFSDSVAKHTWAGNFLKQLNIVELNQSTIDEQMAHRYKKIFENVSLILNASLYNDRSKAARMIGLDPRWKWDKGRVHVPGYHHKHSESEFYGKPRKGYRHATPDEVRKIIVNISNYQIKTNTFIVGSHGVTGQQYTVEAAEQFQRPTIGPDPVSAVAPLFAPDRVHAARDKATRLTGGQVTVH